MYYIVGTKKQYENMQETLKHTIPADVLVSICDKVTLFDKHYGSERDLQKSLGGYCVVFPMVKDWEETYQDVLNKHYIQTELYEYREEITDGEHCWIEELYMIGSDYGIVLFYPKDFEREGGTGQL